MNTKSYQVVMVYETRITITLIEGSLKEVNDWIDNRRFDNWVDYSISEVIVNSPVLKRRLSEVSHV